MESRIDLCSKGELTLDAVRWLDADDGAIGVVSNSFWRGFQEIPPNTGVIFRGQLGLVLATGTCTYAVYNWSQPRLSPVQHSHYPASSSLLADQLFKHR
jgi:hypothetical protein